MGYLKIRIVGSSPERFFNMCAHHSIKIWNLAIIEKEYIFFLSKRDYKEIQPLLKKAKCSSFVLSKKGVPFLLRRNLKRKVFWSGLLLSVLTNLYLTGFIWNIEINGNSFYTTEHLIKFLNENNVYRGIGKGEIKCEDIVSDLRKEFNKITWVSAHIDGTLLVIDIKENEHENMKAENDDSETAGTDIIATEDGVVTSIITRTGVPLVHEGDAVKKGDILVCGRIPILNDSKEIIKYEYVDADADISIEYPYTYNDTISISHSEKEYISKRYFPYIITNDYIFWPIVKPQNGSNYDLTIKRYSLEPEQQHVFSFAIGSELYHYYEEKEVKYTDTELQKVLSERFEAFSNDLKEKKVEILENNVKITIGNSTATAKGSLLLEMHEHEMKVSEQLKLEIKEEEELEE